MTDQVTQQELHTTCNDPQTLNVKQRVHLTRTQAQHVAVVLDLFQAKGTMAKIKDNFATDVVYEDEFAKSGGIDQFAGQLLNIPTVTSDTKTNSYSVVSCQPSSTTNAKGETVNADLILVDLDHEIIFKAPLPKGAKTMHLQTTLHIFSDPASGKIIRLMDRSKDEIEDHSLPNFLRTINSIGVPKVTGLPKDDKEDAEKVLKEQR